MAVSWFLFPLGSVETRTCAHFNNWQFHATEMALNTNLKAKQERNNQKQMKEPKTTKQKLLLFAAPLLFLGINCFMHSKFVLHSLTGSFSYRDWDSLLKYHCPFPPWPTTPHLPMFVPLQVLAHLLINFTNSSYRSSFQYTITRSNSPTIKSHIPFLVSISAKFCT